VRPLLVRPMRPSNPAHRSRREPEGSRGKEEPLNRSKTRRYGSVYRLRGMERSSPWPDVWLDGMFSGGKHSLKSLPARARSSIARPIPGVSCSSRGACTPDRLFELLYLGTPGRSVTESSQTLCWWELDSNFSSGDRLRFSGSQVCLGLLPRRRRGITMPVLTTREGHQAPHEAVTDPGNPGNIGGTGTSS
jgi:hypothetical protein